MGWDFRITGLDKFDAALHALEMSGIEVTAETAGWLKVDAGTMQTRRAMFTHKDGRKIVFEEYITEIFCSSDSGSWTFGLVYYSHGNRPKLHTKQITCFNADDQDLYNLDNDEKVIPYVLTDLKDLLI